MVECKPLLYPLSRLNHGLTAEPYCFTNCLPHCGQKNTHYHGVVLQYKAEHLGWSGSLLLQTEAAQIRNYGREQIDYRYVLYILYHPTSRNPNYPLKALKILSCLPNANEATI